MAVSFLLPLSCVAGSSCKERVRSAWSVGAEIRSQCIFDISVTGLMMNDEKRRIQDPNISHGYPSIIYHYISMFDICYSMFVLYDHFSVARLWLWAHSVPHCQTNASHSMHRPRPGTPG